MPIYKAGADWIQCEELEGLVITVIANDRLAEVVVPRTRTFVVDGNVVVKFHPAVEVVPLETEYYYDDYKGCWEHFFDVFLGDEPATFYASVSGGQIKQFERLL